MSEVRSASATSAREWIETGEQCMERRIFDQVNTMPTPEIAAVNMKECIKALRCFKNANDARRILWAEGSLSELHGRECRASGKDAEFKSHFKEASKSFLAIGMKERAAGCLEALKDFVGAASKRTSPQLFLGDGELF